MLDFFSERLYKLLFPLAMPTFDISLPSHILPFGWVKYGILFQFFEAFFSFQVNLSNSSHSALPFWLCFCKLLFISFDDLKIVFLFFFFKLLMCINLQIYIFSWPINCVYCIIFWREMLNFNIIVFIIFLFLLYGFSFSLWNLRNLSFPKNTKIFYTFFLLASYLSTFQAST